MLLRDAASLVDYWEDFPPPHILVRLAIGFKPHGATGPAPTREELDALVAAYGRAG